MVSLSFKKYHSFNFFYIWLIKVLYEFCRVSWRAYPYSGLRTKFWLSDWHWRRISFHHFFSKNIEDIFKIESSEELFGKSLRIFRKLSAVLLAPIYLNPYLISRGEIMKRSLIKYLSETISITYRHSEVKGIFFLNLKRFL